jgi:hypothetical protein
MERKEIQVLMIDDHKMTLVGYSSALEVINKQDLAYTFKIHHATTFEEALQKLNETFNYRSTVIKNTKQERILVLKSGNGFQTPSLLSLLHLTITC